MGAESLAERIFPLSTKAEQVIDIVCGRENSDLLHKAKEIERTKNYLKLVVPFGGQHSIPLDTLDQFFLENAASPIMLFPEHHTQIRYFMEANRILEYLVQLSHAGAMQPLVVSTNKLRVQDIKNLSTDISQNIDLIKTVYEQMVMQTTGFKVTYPDTWENIVEQVARTYAFLVDRGIHIESALPSVIKRAPVPNIDTFSRLTEIIEQNRERKVFYAIGAGHLLSTIHGLPLQDMCGSFYKI